MTFASDLLCYVFTMPLLICIIYSYDAPLYRSNYKYNLFLKCQSFVVLIVKQGLLMGDCDGDIYHSYDI